MRSIHAESSVTHCRSRSVLHNARVSARAHFAWIRSALVRAIVSQLGASRLCAHLPSAAARVTLLRRASAQRSAGSVAHPLPLIAVPYQPCASVKQLRSSADAGTMNPVARTPAGYLRLWINGRKTVGNGRSSIRRAVRRAANASRRHFQGQKSSRVRHFLQIQPSSLAYPLRRGTAPAATITLRGHRNAADPQPGSAGDIPLVEHQGQRQRAIRVDPAQAHPVSTIRRSVAERNAP
jgi:hypothetical protein